LAVIGYLLLVVGCAILAAAGASLTLACVRRLRGVAPHPGSWIASWGDQMLQPVSSVSDDPLMRFRFWFRFLFGVVLLLAGLGGMASNLWAAINA
jgi:hypothetical protein